MCGIIMKQPELEPHQSSSYRLIAVSKLTLAMKTTCGQEGPGRSVF